MYVCVQIDDYSMVRFLPFDRTDEEGINIVLQNIDFSIQYGEDLEFKEPKVRRKQEDRANMATCDFRLCCMFLQWHCIPGTRVTDMIFRINYYENIFALKDVIFYTLTCFDTL